jgi:ribonuclease VapC
VIAVDASAVLAILLNEPGGSQFTTIIEARGGVISPVNYWEVLARSHSESGAAGASRARALIGGLGLQVAAISIRDADLAYEAFARFGKGMGGPLNLGDCFAYALAEVQSDGLLFKGDDFPKTDVKSARV